MISLLYPGAVGGHVAAAADDDGIDEVLVQVIDELGDRSSIRPDDGDVVEHRQMLHQLAQPDAAGVRAHRHAELRRHQDHREVLVDAAEPAAVDLAEANRLRLQQLLEDDPVVAVLAGRHADRPHASRNRRMPEHVVRARRLLDPPADRTARARARARSLRSTSQLWLASIISRRSGPISSRTSASRRASSAGRAADLHLEVGPAVGDAPRGTSRRIFSSE